MPSGRTPVSPSREVSALSASRARRAMVLRLLPLGLLVFAGIAAPTLIFRSGGLERLERLEEEKKQVDIEVSRIRERIHFLDKKAKALRADPAYVERVARDRLGLVRQTEVVFHFHKTK